MEKLDITPRRLTPLRMNLLDVLNPHDEREGGAIAPLLLRLLAISSYFPIHILSHCDHLIWDGKGPRFQPFTFTDQAGKTLDHGNGMR